MTTASGLARREDSKCGGGDGGSPVDHGVFFSLGKTFGSIVIDTAC